MPIPHSILWEIVAVNHHKSYLLGSIHIEDTQLNALKKVIEKYISLADIVGIEVNLFDAKNINLEPYIFFDPLGEPTIGKVRCTMLEVSIGNRHTLLCTIEVNCITKSTRHKCR